jgi:hypothetical protein
MGTTIFRSAISGSISLLFTISLLCTITLLAGSSSAQSGGQFSITQSVIAGGGTGPSSGGTYEVNGTAGQPAAGGSYSGLPYSFRSGFWQMDLSPSASLVSVAGRVRTADGRGIRNAVIMLSRSGEQTRIARSGSFGYFQIDDVEAGQTYIITVGSKLFTFTPQMIVLTDSIGDIELVAIP